MRVVSAFGVLALVAGADGGSSRRRVPPIGSRRISGCPGRDYNRDMPACDYPPALDRIIGNFRTKEVRFWNSELQIVGIEDIRETAVLPWAAQSIPRRFCSGTALINDGTRHPIYYSIAEDTGMIGMDWGVNFCVVGLDRNWAYGPRLPRGRTLKGSPPGNAECLQHGSRSCGAVAQRRARQLVAVLALRWSRDIAVFA